jgi:sugar phosphate isomerase/epimerase
MNRKIELLAGFWTIAGDCYAMGPSEVATFPLRNRVEAAAAGYTGLGLVHQDFVHNAKAIGYPAMKRMFDDHGIVDVEVEFLGDWFETGEKKAASDRIRKTCLKRLTSFAPAISNAPAKCGPTSATSRRWATPSQASASTRRRSARQSPWRSCR